MHYFALATFYEVLSKVTCKHCSFEKEVVFAPDIRVTLGLYVAQCCLDLADLAVFENALFEQVCHVLARQLLFYSHGLLLRLNHQIPGW